MKILVVAVALSALFVGVMTSHSHTLTTLSERTVKTEMFTPKTIARTGASIEDYQPF